MPQGEADGHVPLKHQQGAAFASVACDGVDLLLSGMKAGGLSFRNEMLSGPGGRQVQLLDPDGSPIELFEPAPRP